MLISKQPKLSDFHSQQRSDASNKTEKPLPKDIILKTGVERRLDAKSAGSPGVNYLTSLEKNCWVMIFTTLRVLRQ